MNKTLVKLVRDNIPQFVGDSKLSYEPIEDENQRVEMLRAKLIEECIEYALNPCPDELADVMEVCTALAKYDLKVGWAHVERVGQEKVDERGAFDEGLAMYCYTAKKV